MLTDEELQRLIRQMSKDDSKAMVLTIAFEAIDKYAEHTYEIYEAMLTRLSTMHGIDE